MQNFFWEVRGLFGNNWNTGREQTYKKGKKFIFLSWGSKRYLLMKFKLTVSDKHFSRKIDRNHPSHGYPEHSTPYAQCHADDSYMGTRFKMYDGCINVVHIIVFLTEQKYSFNRLYFVRCRIFMSRDLIIFLIIRCLPLCNMPNTFHVISSWIFSAPPAHLYLLCVDISFENNICPLFKSSFDT